MRFKKNFDLTNNHLNESDIALYIDYLLTNNLNNLPPAILTHVEICSECKDQILDVFLFLRNSKRFTKPDFSEPLLLKEKKVKQKNLFYISRIAASFFILAFIIFIYFSFIKKDINQQTGRTKNIQNSHYDFNNKIKIKSKKNSTKITENEIPDYNTYNKSIFTKEQKKISNPNFEVNPNLEYMINSQLRHVSIQIFSPKNNSSFKKKIKFSWEPTSNKNLQIKILDNKNNVLLQYSVKNNSFLLEEKLSPGLYYWKLESFSDLLYVGKFYINKDAIPPPK